MQTKVSILIVDRRYSLTTELRDDSKTTSSESIGLATYSNSKPTVLSYVSFFESLWNQVNLYEHLWDSNKNLELSIGRLQARDEAQNVFINIAAQLRTPIQPILVLSTVLRSHKKNIEKDKLLDAIVRNATRLRQGRR